MRSGRTWTTWLPTTTAGYPERTKAPPKRGLRLSGFRPYRGFLLFYATLYRRVRQGVKDHGLAALSNRVRNMAAPSSRWLYRNTYSLR